MVRRPPRFRAAGKGFRRRRVSAERAAGSTISTAGRSRRWSISATSTSSTCLSGRKALAIWHLTSDTAVQGYNVVHWTAEGMDFWAVSDVERAQLDDFAALWRKAP